jgi:hypothetical protein
MNTARKKGTRRELAAFIAATITIKLAMSTRAWGLPVVPVLSPIRTSTSFLPLLRQPFDSPD